MAITGLSGNEIYCLDQKGYSAGNIVVGNSVYSLGVIGTLGAGIQAALGGELAQVTQLIEEGREAAYKRMLKEAIELKGTGITGVTSELIFHSGCVEFLSIGSLLHSRNENETSQFSTSDKGQELFGQMDAGYKPICFAFGNVAYSMGLARGLIGTFKTLGRGEIKEFSDMFNHTRHLALERIRANASKFNANAVLGIKTTILPFGGVNEMLMIGTASHHATLPANTTSNMITSGLTNIEMWNLAKMGYAPVQLLLGTSIYSLGLIGGISSLLKTFVRGEINELSKLIYDARENALGIISDEAKAIGADEVVGVQTYVYQLGNGLIEFLAIGTAVKKIPGLKTESEQLPPQAVITDKSMFYNTVDTFSSVNVNTGSKPLSAGALVKVIGIVVLVIVVMWLKITGR